MSDTGFVQSLTPFDHQSPAPPFDLQSSPQPVSALTGAAAVVLPTTSVVFVLHTTIVVVSPTPPPSSFSTPLPPSFSPPPPLVDIKVYLEHYSKEVSCLMNSLDMDFKNCMVVIDTESKPFDNPLSPDPPFVIVWEIAIISLTQNIKVSKGNGKVYSVLMKPSETRVIKKKLPSRIKDEEWETSMKLESKELQEKLKKKLNGKFWIGWNVSRIDRQNIEKIFTDVVPPTPLGVFDVLNWARTLDLKTRHSIADLRLSTIALALKIKEKQVHRAKEDAMLCYYVFQSLIRDERLSVENVYEIMQSRRTT